MEAVKRVGIPIFFVLLAIVYFSTAFWYKNNYGLYNSTTDSVNNLLSIKRQALSASIDPLVANTESVCAKLSSNTGVYSKTNIPENSTAIVNWRPLSVRMAGYLGGIHTVLDGVFDMSKGIQLALQLGARCFIFDIDYLDEKPCVPCLIHRDNQGVMRSLHTGSIRDGMDALKTGAFNSNYDPVIVVLYLRRIPQGTIQKTNYFKAIAAALDPLSTNHLGSTEQGNFHNCRSEKALFTSEITNFQKKFIVLCNYNTNLLPSTSNPKDNLDFWTNARLYVDPSGKSSTLGDITNIVPTGQIAYAQVGATSQYLNVPESSKAAVISGCQGTFTIALSPITDTFTTTQLATLLNTLGIQCVPIDVVRLGSTKCHVATLTNPTNPTTVEQLSNPTNPEDPLSFWTYAGWSRKYIQEGFTTKVPVAAKIPGFVIPKPTVPKKPPPSTNSNGGLVNIA